MSGGIEPVSRPGDAPQYAPTADMEPAAKAASALAAAANDAARLEENAAAAAAAAAAAEQSSNNDAPQLVASPGPMDVDDGKHLSPDHMDQGERHHHGGSISYSGSSFHTQSHLNENARGMTYPMPSPVQGSPTSGGSKKHKCPCCNTEFTRHHNLKSHLLTHSQEKPYVCTDCQMRFRRLHDLKRHGKLHTGEKPHICPKCDRKFARGDALARHAKGAGGCAGRRFSMGSFADGDEMDDSMANPDDSAMSGMTYDHGDDEELRRQSLPGGGHSTEQYSAQSRTYPPSGPRQPAATAVYQPSTTQTQSSNSTASSAPNSMGTTRTGNTSVSSAATGNGGTGLYSQNTMTESPKALSPALPAHETAAPGRPRSPTQSQQAQSARRQSPPAGQRPKLPGLSQTNFAGPPTSAGLNHARSPSETNMFAQSDPSVWAYIQSMEDKMKNLVAEVDSLKRRVEVLESAAANN